jgi:iron complex outermembrane receptor protein
MSFKKKPLIAASLFMLASATHAQANSDLQAVTVYGSRFQETIENALPQTTIITATEIEKSGLTNVSEILQKLGNIPVKIDLRGGNNVSIDMRGYGDTADNNVVVLLDGVRLSEDEGAPARISIIPVEAIEHIEIHKGGSSVLYGNGATSGYINIITKKYNKDQIVLSGGVGSFNAISSSAYASKKINDVNFSVFGKTNHSDNYRDNNKTNEQSIGSVIQWNPSDKTSAGIRVFGNQEKAEQPGALPSIYLNSSPKQTQVPGYQSNFEFDSSNITLFGSHKIENIELSADLNNRKKKTDWVYNYDASSVSSQYYSGGYPTAWGQTNSETTTNSFSPRLKVNHFLSKDNSIIFGYDWSKWNLKSTGRKNNTEPGYEENPSFTNKSGNHKADGIYFYDDWKLSSTDRFIFGGRRQRYEQTGNTIYGATPSYASSYVWQGVTYSSTSDGSYGHQIRQYLNAYEIQYSKKLGYGFEPYIKQGNSFRLPTADDNSLTSTGNPLKPQISQDQEVGLKWNNAQSMIKVSFFKSDLTDEIIFSDGSNKNEVPTTKKGVDTSIKHKFNSTFTGRLNLQIIDAQISQGENTGKKTPGVAQSSGGFGVETNLSNNHIIDISARGATGKYASEDTSNTQAKSSGYLVGDAAYIVKDKSWTWVARIENILDKKYSDYSIYKSSSAYDIPFKMTLYPNPGRNFSISGRYVF